MIFGYAVVIRLIMLIAKSLFMNIWFGMSPEMSACPWKLSCLWSQQNQVTG